jgi:hypothetical protein
MKREALTLALEALEESQTDNDTMEFWDRKSKAITAIKEALAQTQGPVAQWLEDAFREGWEAYRESEFASKITEDWAFGNSFANCRMIDLQQNTPQQPAQEPINLLEARRIAAEYGTPDSQVDDGNLYFALSKCLQHIDAQPAQEQNFCLRCGKRTPDTATIHTCTLPSA